MRNIFLILFFPILLFGAIRDFSIFELSGKEPGNTLLVIGGIHGDEPGGYFAPALVTKHYSITKGNLIVVPNLNFDSIVLNRRGIYGDMNRKFHEISKKDADFTPVSRIKELITDPRVDFVINLHDGHGFYRNEWENSIFNPLAWGQAYIIDQKSIDDVKFGNLDEITSRMVQRLNKSNLAIDHHTFSVKNTQTKHKDEQMQMSLTYFAITHLKPALAIETSKNISELDTKVLYQLRSMEAIMDEMGIEYHRDFELNKESIDTLIKEYGEVVINERFTLPLEGSKDAIYYVPLKSKENKFEFTHPLGAVVDRKEFLQVMVGNIPIVRLYPQYFDLKCSKNSTTVFVDGVQTEVRFGEKISAKKTFMVKEDPAFRVNLIGFVTKDRVSQDGIEVKKSDFIPRFSLDKEVKTFRVEFYQDENFCGTLTVVYE